MSSTAQLSAKDRITTLLDDNSFVEVGALVTKRSTDFNLLQKEAPSDGVVTGYGLIEGCPVYVYSQDTKVLHGTMGEMHAGKIARLYDMALKVGAPVIALIDCAGLRLEEATDALAGFGEVFYKQTLASGVIPQITAVFGTCGGGSAVSASLSDFVFMEEKNAKLFVNAPNTINNNYTGKCDTSAAAFMAQAGVADFVGKDEETILGDIRKLLMLLPANNKVDAAFGENEDDLNRELPAFTSEMADPSAALKDISDNGLFLEVKAAYAKEMVTGFLTLNGTTIGAVANRTAVLDDQGKATEHYESVLTTAGCYKAEAFIKFCDSFNIPVLTLTNTTGFGTSMNDAKSVGIAAAKLTYAFANATVPKINLITEKAYGSAYLVMNSKHIGADLVFALDNAEIGTMDADLAAQILYPEETVESRKAKAAEYQALAQSASSAAKRGYVDAIFAGEAVRKQLAYGFEMLYSKRESRPSKKHGTV